MKNKLLILGLIWIVASCSSQKRALSLNGIGDTRTKPVSYINDNIYLLTEKTDDPSYGFDPANAIKVGGSKESSGPKNERRFLNALLGPNGENVGYYRTGSCCFVKTPNALFGDKAPLDEYKVYWMNSDTLRLYLNMYDEGDLKIPVGFTAKTYNH